jgi:hypothetical protein
MAQVQNALKHYPEPSRCRKASGRDRRLKNEKYYEQTQHLVENKESGFEEPSKYLKNRLA